MNLLIFRIGSIGDTSIALPALWQIKRQFRTAYIHILTNFPVSTSGKESPLSQIIDGTGIADSYLEYPAGQLGLHELLRMRAKIRALHVQMLIYLMPTRSFTQLLRDWLFFKACGIKQIIGLKFSKNAQSRRYDQASGLWEHEANRLGRLIDQFGSINLSDSHALQLALTPAETSKARECLSVLCDRPFFAMSVGTKVAAKDWGEENWVELTRQLSTLYLEYGLVFIGSHDEFDRCQRVANHWPQVTLNLCGKLSPRVSAAVLGKAALFIGHDSGPMHLAASVVTPVVAIFSARNKPGEWYPLGAGHRVLYNKIDCFGCSLDVCSVHQNKCILGITVSSVVNAVAEILCRRYPNEY